MAKQKKILGFAHGYQARGVIEAAYPLLHEPRCLNRFGTSPR
jgi:hypothetical protein